MFTFATNTRLIAALRSLGGRWSARRQGFGSWAYEGSLDGCRYDILRYAHYAPRFDGDDDSFVCLWHVKRDGEPFGVPTRDPAFMLRELLATEASGRTEVTDGRR